MEIATGNSRLVHTSRRKHQRLMCDLKYDIAQISSLSRLIDVLIIKKSDCPVVSSGWFLTFLQGKSRKMLKDNPRMNVRSIVERSI